MVNTPMSDAVVVGLIAGGAIVLAAVIAAMGLFPAWRGMERVNGRLRSQQTEIQARLLDQYERVVKTVGNLREKNRELEDKLDVQADEMRNIENAYLKLRNRLEDHERELEASRKLVTGWIHGWQIVLKQMEENQLVPNWKPDTDQLKL